MLIAEALLPERRPLELRQAGLLTFPIRYTFPEKSSGKSVTDTKWEIQLQVQFRPFTGFPFIREKITLIT